MIETLSHSPDAALHWGDARLPERFWNKVAPEPNSGCFLWLGTAPNGYGQIQWKVGDVFKRVGAHILAVLASGRSIPAGWTVDHRCETTVCVNAQHLEVVTNAENTRRYHERHPITHCPAGHEYSTASVYRFGRKMKCRACHQVQNARTPSRMARVK